MLTSTRKRLFIFPVVFFILALGGYFLLRSKINPVAPTALTPATAYWAFDEGFGQTVSDQSGHANTGTLGANNSVDTDDPVWVPNDLCITGKCLGFNSSSSQFVNIAGSIAGIKTVSFWVRTSSVASISLLVLNGAAGNASLTTNAGGVIQAGAGFASPTIYINGSVNSTLTANLWQYVTVTTATGITASNVMLGRVNTGYFNGFLDEVKLYDYALTATQVIPDFASRGSPGGAAATFGRDNKWLSDGLVGYWKLDEASGTLADSSGNTNTGTWSGTGGSHYTAGKFGNGGGFGTDDFISASSNASFQIAGNMTVSTWFNTGSVTGTHEIVSLRTSGGVARYVLTQINHTIQMTFGLTGGSVQPSLANAVDAGTWYHLVAVLNGTTGKLYINGVEVSTANGTGTMQTTAQPLYIGSSLGTSNFFNGTLDDTRIYNRALSPAEVSQLYSWAPGPVGYWKFDEGTGSTANDSSGHNNSATIVDGGTSVGNWETGQIGSTYHMKGHDPVGVDIIYLTDLLNPISLGTRNTLSFWVNFDSYEDGATQGSVIGGNATDANAGYMLYIDNSNIYSRQATGTGVSISNTLSLHTWYYLTVVRDGTSVKFFSNGIQLGTTLTLGANNAFTMLAVSNMGFGLEDYPINGMLDDVRVYDYPRTQAQIVQDMNSGHPVPGSPVESSQVWYRFDEGHDSTANNAGFGGSTSNGTIANGTWTTGGKFGKALTFGATTSVTAGLGTAPLYSNTISAWLYPVTSVASKSIVKTITDKLNTDSSSQPVYGSCTGTPLSLSTWTHIVAVSDGSGSCAIYQNGVLTSSGTTGVTLGNALNIGGSSFLGNIDEFKLYNIPLTADQVKVEYNQGKSQVMGSLGTTSTGAASNSESDSYCPPGQGSTCIGPAGEWKLDENTGVTAHDTSGNNNNGNIYATPSWATGKIGSGLKFHGTGSTDRIEISPNAAINNFTQMTGEAWINPTSLGAGNGGRIFQKASTTLNGRGLYLSANNSLTYYHGWSTSTGQYAFWTTPNNSIQLNQWNHVVVTYDESSTANSPIIYINGISQTLTVGSAPSGVTGDDSAANFEIGNRLNDPIYDRAFDGTIDEVRYYNYLRTPAQIAWDYNRGAPVAWYKFDECSGNTTYNFALNANGQTAGMNGTINLVASDQTTIGNCTTNDNTPWYNGRNGKYNSALNFDGIDDYVRIDDVSNMHLPTTGNGSFSFWAERTADTADSQAALSFLVSAPTDDTYLNITPYNPNQCSGYISVSETWSPNTWTYNCTTTTAPLNTWGHFVFVVDTSDEYLYYNGKVIWSGGGRTATPAAPIAMMIGNRFYTATAFNGLIDDVRIYDYALTPGQIANLYAGGGSAVRFGQ